MRVAKTVPAITRPIIPLHEHLKKKTQDKCSGNDKRNKRPMGNIAHLKSVIVSFYFSFCIFSKYISKLNIEPLLF